MRTPRKFAGLLVLLIGALSLCIQLSYPRLRALLPSDVFGLVAAGLCLGVGVAMTINNRIARAK